MEMCNDLPSSLINSNEFDISSETVQEFYRPLTGPERKYGRNGWHELQLCPRCVCANPVKVELDIERRMIRLLCKKCLFYGHKDGALIREVPFKEDYPRIMDG